MIRRRHMLAAAFACLALATATACGSSGSTTDAGNPAAQEDATPCPAVNKADIDPTATFTWMYSVDTTSFDPDKITTNNSQMYLYPIYDSLTHIDAKGEPQPMLAKKWTVGDGGKSLTLDLISNWKYQDGTPFDAASVKANLDRHRAAGSWNEEALKDITNVAVVDQDTVKVDTNGGAAALVNIFAGSAGMMMSPAVFDDPNQALKPTGGSGAFTMTSYTPGSKVEYTAVKNYWDPDSLHVAKMVYLVSGDDNARLNSVSTGVANATFLRASMYQPAKDAGLVICQRPSLSMYTMNLNIAKPNLGKKEVRQAINYAIDRNAIKSLTDGFCTPAIQMFPPSYFAANPDLGPDDYKYNPDKAKDLLKKAGLDKGFEFSLDVQNLDIYKQIAEVIQANLKDVGISMKIIPVDISKAPQDFSVDKSVDAYLGEQKVDADPSIEIESYYLKGGFNNPGGYDNPKVAQLAEEAKSGADTEARAKSYAELMKTVYEDAAPNVTLCHLTTPFTLDHKTMGVEIYTDASRQFRGVAIKK